MFLTLRTELHQAARACWCKEARVMAQNTAQFPASVFSKEKTSSRSLGDQGEYRRFFASAYFGSSTLSPLT